MRKKTWTTIISFIVVLLVLEICFVLWGESETKTEALRIQSLKKSTSGCKVVSKDFNIKSKKEKTSSINNSSVVFPSYKETIQYEKDGWITVKEPTSLLVLVNKSRKLPDNYIPPKLVIPNVRFSFDEIVEKRYMREVAAKPLEELFKKATEDGQILYAVSGYRSYKRQVSVFDLHVHELGEQQAKEVSAIPGSSEHQTGLSIDVSSESAKFKLTTDFGLTSEGKWLKENAHKFGFIIRYPEDKINITGYSYEPWHIRYVGVSHATYLYTHNLALEEAIK